jgi:hypothetical protein
MCHGRSCPAVRFSYGHVSRPLRIGGYQGGIRMYWQKPNCRVHFRATRRAEFQGAESMVCYAALQTGLGVLGESA